MKFTLFTTLLFASTASAAPGSKARVLSRRHLHRFPFLAEEETGCDEEHGEEMRKACPEEGEEESKNVETCYANCYGEETSDPCIAMATWLCCLKKCTLEEFGAACASAHAGNDDCQYAEVGCGELKCAEPSYGLKGAAAA